VAQFLEERYDDFSGNVTERALCSHLRHQYTNYEAILAETKGLVGAGALYVAVKVLLCCQIIRRYSLVLNPLTAAFGNRENVPADYLTGEPERVAENLLAFDRTPGEEGWTGV
jgi:hypothetical protein